MGLIERLYPIDTKYLQGIWDVFIFINPDMPFYRYRYTREALSAKDKGALITPIRNSFFLEMGDEEIQERYRQAMNRGIKTVNSLCQQYLGEESSKFRIQEITGHLDLFEFLNTGRENWIEGRRRDSKHTPNPELILAAYNSLRSYGLSYRVLMIDHEPKVINSINTYEDVLRWFEKVVRFGNAEASEDEEFPLRWNTKAGIRVYGRDSPMNSRVKVLNPDGSIRYDSMLMKMYLKQAFFDEIDDYTGIEFIVESEEDRKRLVDLFRTDTKPSLTMEDFKYQKRGERRANDNSSVEFGVAKFGLRALVPVELKGQKFYERVPVEVQILTLEDDKIRRKNPDVTHSEYKRRQFKQVFPAWFPLRIYEPLICNP